MVTTATLPTIHRLVGVGIVPRRSNLPAGSDMVSTIPGSGGGAYGNAASEQDCGQVGSKGEREPRRERRNKY